MQGKSLVTQQVTAEVDDGTKVFHLLGHIGLVRKDLLNIDFNVLISSGRAIIIDTRPLTDPSASSIIYILMSEDTT